MKSDDYLGDWMLVDRLERIEMDCWRLQAMILQLEKKVEELSG